MSFQWEKFKPTQKKFNLKTFIGSHEIIGDNLGCYKIESWNPFWLKEFISYLVSLEKKNETKMSYMSVSHVLAIQRK